MREWGEEEEEKYSRRALASKKKRIVQRALLPQSFSITINHKKTYRYQTSLGDMEIE